ncbi:MAG: PAS domain S-box protein [Promethearchaeota archaeon]
MRDEDKGKDQLIKELNQLHQQLNELRAQKVQQDMLESILRQERDRAQKYLDIAGVIMVVLNPDQTIALINKKGCDILGYEKEEDVLGKNWFNQFLPERIREDVRTVFAQLMAGGIEIGEYYENPILTKYGKEKIIAWHNTVIHDEAGAIKQTLSSGEDITEHKKAKDALQESEAKFRSLAEQSPNMIFINKKGRVVYANKLCEETMGYTREEFYAPEFNFLTLIAPESRDVVMENYEKHMKDEKTNSYQYEVLTRDGRRIPVWITSKLIEFENEPAILGVVTDISELKQKEEQLQQEITERKQAEEALRQAKLAEERYHTMLGHFLKNNLHEIVNNLEYFALANQLDQKLSETIVNKIMNISFRSSRTIEAVNKIFTVLQTPFGHYQKTLNFLEVIQRVISELRVNMAFSNPVTIKHETIDVEIISNLYLKDVFSEILLFMLSPTNGEITIEGDQSSSFFCVSIQDCHSLPISEEVCIRLAGTITDKWESQGHFIGISLASVIMQHYDGKLIIDPSEHQGNTFQLLFPSHLIRAKK